MKGASGERSEAGYSMIVLMASVTIMLILLGAATPGWRYLTKNDREEELIFRGGQIADAIQRYQRKNGNALPPSLDVLVKGKFLRKAYKDPMVPDGKWRFLRPGEAVVPGARSPGTPGRPGPGARRPTPTPTPPGTGVGLPDGRQRGGVPDPGGGQPEHRQEPADLQRPGALQRVALHPWPAPRHRSADGAGDSRHRPHASRRHSGADAPSRRSQTALMRGRREVPTARRRR